MDLEDVYDYEDRQVDDKKTTVRVYFPRYKGTTKQKIFSPIRNKYLDALPEEIVRQEFICKLINDYGYQLGQMDEEVKLTSSQRGTGRASADIVVWKSEKEKKGKKTAFLVVELKANTLKLKVEDCYQGYNYATWSRAKLFAVSNGTELQVYKTIEDELPLSLQPVNDIPQVNEILDDKKLEEALAKTKEFTGNEFATLLHKCHNIIRNNDKLSPEASFDEISKILFIKIMYERNPTQEAIFSLKQFETMKQYHLDKDKSYMQYLFDTVKKKFKKDGIFDEHEKIKLRERSFEEIVKELQIYNLTATSADVKGIAFEKFLGRTFRGELGQFFTPRVIVDFIVDTLDPKENELVCDPCAGSGGFLIKAFETVKDAIDTEFIKVKKKKYEEIFGTFKRLSDDEEAKLKGEALEKYEGEKEKFLENLNNKKLNDTYEEFLKKTNEEQESRIKKLSHDSIFGTDANPRMARVSKMNMIMHGDGHNGIHHNDGLLNINGIFRNRFDMIVTNPPFGTNLDKEFPTVEEDDRYTNEDMIEKYIEKYGGVYQEEMEQVTGNIKKPIRDLFAVGKMSGATEVLFIERCLDLLKSGGRMGIVLPEGVLNSSNLQGAREYFESRAKIMLIVSLPQDIFVSSGATVKTSLLFFRKFTNEEALEYKQIQKKALASVDAKYFAELEPIEEKLKLRGKDAPSKEEKKQLRINLKAIENKKAEETRAIIKDKFDYEVPISEIKVAGITTTGAAGKNELPKLLELFTAYRKEHKLWDEAL